MEIVKIRLLRTTDHYVNESIIHTYLTLVSTITVHTEAIQSSKSQ